MNQRLTFYPIGNAETCLLELKNGDKILFDYAATYTGSNDDQRYDIKATLSQYKNFKIVMFTHAHDDHLKGAGDFFYLEHDKKYQSDDRARIDELWVSAAFILDSNLENQSDAKIIRAEAQYRLKRGSGIKVFAEPTELSKWLDDNNISSELVDPLIIHAGTLIPPDKFDGEMQIYVHAPFSVDSESIADRNAPSIMLQLRLFNQPCETNILITGDTPQTMLDKIVEISKENSNEEYLEWDIYDIPHHCSHTGLNTDNQNDAFRITPSDNVLWLLNQSSDAGMTYMVASCEPVTEETSPPHISAKRSYERNTKENVNLLITMEHTSKNLSQPTPIVFEFGQFGMYLKEIDTQRVYFNRVAPRAGLI